MLGDEKAAYQYLEQLRWRGAPDRCPHCMTPGRCYYLRPRDGSTRATRTGKRSARRVWKCGACRRQFSVLTGSVLEGTRIALLAWIAVLDDLAALHDGADLPTPAGIADKCQVSRESARHMLDRLRAAFELDSAGLWLPSGLATGMGRASAE